MFYLVVGKLAEEGASVLLEQEVAKILTVGVKVDTNTGESAFVRPSGYSHTTQCGRCWVTRGLEPFEEI